MRRDFRWAGLLLVPVFVLPALGADKKKDDKKDDANAATKQEYALLAQAGQVEGRLIAVDPKARTFTFQIDYQTLEPKDDKGGKDNQARKLLKEEEKILREQREILRARNPVEQQRKLQHLILEMERLQLKNGGQNPFKVVTHHKDFDLEATDDAKVLLKDPPVEYDDKGFPKKLTAQELKELRGNLPGYPTEFTNLKKGQAVKITFAKKKKDDKDADDKPQVSQVLVTAEPPADKTGKDKKDKKD